MPTFLILIMAVYGGLSIFFAFRQPPMALASMFKIPILFAFLPDRVALVAGRLFVGVASLGLAFYLFAVSGR
jgi:hypothetical protein